MASTLFLKYTQDLDKLINLQILFSLFFLCLNSTRISFRCSREGMFFLTMRLELQPEVLDPQFFSADVY